MIIGDLLDNVRIVSGALQLDVGLYPFQEIVFQAVDLLKPLAEEKNIELNVTGSAAASPVACDRDRMLQVLSNLLGNALKFTAASGKVEVETNSCQDALFVCVRDTGRGIAPEDLPQVFEKYWHRTDKAGDKGLTIFMR